MGYFSHSILVTELNFVLGIHKFQFSWNSSEIPEFIVEFLKIDMVCQFHLILITEIDFALTISNFNIFLELFQIWIFSGNCYFGQIQPIGHDSHSICTQIFKIFLEFFQILSENLKILLNLLFSQISTYGELFPFHFHCWVHFCTQNQTIQFVLFIWNTGL